MNRDELPLLYQTPPAWAASVLRDPLALLSDHAHLEKKAAANALELLNRWPAGLGDAALAQWVRTLTAIARDEVEHLAVVTRLIERRGGRLARLHRNPYATALRAFVRLGRGNLELLDRLLVSALIELRSCERFEILAAAADPLEVDAPQAELARLYRGLHASEHGHYKTFLTLADHLADAADVLIRWHEALRFEASVIADQPPGPRMHSGTDAPPP